MRIAVLGRGSVGGTLGRRWREAGHDVFYGVRVPEQPDEKTVADAAGEAGVVVLAVPWRAAGEVLATCGDLSGKVLLDCTNPLKPDMSGLDVGPATSAGEQVSAWAKDAAVVKIFNSTGANNMADPSYGGRPITMLYAGDDDAAKQVAADLARDLGFDPVDAGPLRVSRLLEPFALLWISLALGQGMGRDIALTLVRRKPTEGGAQGR